MPLLRSLLHAPSNCTCLCKLHGDAQEPSADSSFQELAPVHNMSYLDAIFNTHLDPKIPDIEQYLPYGWVGHDLPDVAAKPIAPLPPSPVSSDRQTCSISSSVSSNTGPNTTPTEEFFHPFPHLDSITGHYTGFEDSLPPPGIEAPEWNLESPEPSFGRLNSPQAEMEAAAAVATPIAVSPHISPNALESSYGTAVQGDQELSGEEHQRQTACSPTLGDSGAATSSQKTNRTRRVPHCQVERKYREGLNAGLERLRLTIPDLHRYDHFGRSSKQSKGATLANAIKYIKFIESDRNKLRDELRELRTRLGHC